MNDQPNDQRSERTEPAAKPATGRLPSEADPAPAPERERATAAEVETNEGVDRGGTGEPVGRDNIREGRVDGLIGGPHQSQGQGQGG